MHAQQATGTHADNAGAGRPCPPPTCVDGKPPGAERAPDGWASTPPARMDAARAAMPLPWRPWRGHQHGGEPAASA
eukprot:1199351-Alexandrium_andersonii.AAC.1